MPDYTQYPQGGYGGSTGPPSRAQWGTASGTAQHPPSSTSPPRAQRLPQAYPNLQPTLQQPLAQVPLVPQVQQRSHGGPQHSMLQHRRNSSDLHSDANQSVGQRHGSLGSCSPAASDSISDSGAGMSPDDVMSPAKMVGSLYVRSNGLLRNWKQRWYELRGTSLYYFKAHDGKLSGRIPMDGSEIDVEAPPNVKNKFTLTNHQTNRVYDFQAESPKAMDQWVACMHEAIVAFGTSPTGGVASRRSVDDKSQVSLALANLKLFETDERKLVSIDDFELISQLGRGSYGRVLRVQKKDTGGFHALKIMRKDAITKPREVMSERAVLQLVDHPFVVKLINAFQTPSKLFLVLTYLPGGDLKHHLRQGTLFPEEKARFYAAGILLALAHLHKCSIIYRDLKPENIVLDETGYPVLTDMGLARELTWDPMAYTFCGTPLYVAPEVLKNKGYTKAVDWWSYGIILYEMLVGITPFAAKTAQAVFQLIMSKAPVIPNVLSPNARDLLVLLLVKEPDRRLSEPELIKTHPFFTGVKWDKLVRRQYAVPGGFTRCRSASEKLEPDQIQAILDEFKEEQASTKHKPNTFQGFTFVGDGSDPAPLSPSGVRLRQHQPSSGSVGR
ncbi:RAC family serine/threonine-protein kinase-like protein [Diplonema papillatum]|nr:RAC family serine/threonine-protein kinase-like protein [Diplonema papillatum]